MHKKTKNRLLLSGGFFLTIALGIYIILYNLSDNIAFFVTPSDLIAQTLHDEVKLGGYVKQNSLKTLDIDEIEFEITDRTNYIKVRYKGFIPSIFREDQGVVVTGTYDTATKIFIAKELLAKHDERYMPKKLNNKLPV